MAAALQPTDDIHTNIDDENHEIFCLIWLDANMNTHETRNTEEKLRSIIHHLKKFPNVKQCQQYIEQRPENDQLILIVSGQMGREMVPSIHDLRQVISIYVYCMDKKKNEEWACKFKKVKAVIVEFDELVSRIKGDHKIQKKVEESLSINVYKPSDGAGKSTTGVEGAFIFSQVLIDCLLRLKSTQVDKQELIDLCKIRYKGQPFEVKKLYEFERDYSPKKALWWYTRKSFFYETLNAALRNQDIHLIFLFRTYISDIQRRLKKYQAPEPLQVYRGQRMSSIELKTLKQSLGQLISVNSFFSTSINKESALAFLNQSDGPDDLERLLFIIDADPKMVTTKPFADITNHSYFADELEVLFMLGSIFRLKTIDRNDDDHLWSVRMTLCSEDENDLKEVLMYMKQQTGDGHTNLQTLGKILLNMGELDLAETYFNRLLKELPSNDPLHSNLYEDLATIASLKHDFDKSVQLRAKSIKLMKEHQTNSSTGQSASHVNLNTKWKQDGLTIAGGNGKGNQLTQLFWPQGIYVDDKDRCVYIADSNNHRIVEWKYDAKVGQVVAGGDKKGNEMNKLNCPVDVIVDEKTDSLIICDQGNRRIVRWPLENGTTGEEIISKIDCSRLTMDNNGDLYVSDYEKNEVRRWRLGEKNGTIVAGGNGEGNMLNQLSYPTYIFVDQDYSVYVSDNENHRVMKWMKGAKEGIVVAGGKREGNSLSQLYCPQGVTVDHLGNVYVADSYNDRVVCWEKGSSDSRIIIGEHKQGQQPNQFNHLGDLSFDRDGNLYVTDYYNHRVQKYDIDLN